MHKVLPFFLRRLGVFVCLLVFLLHGLQLYRIPYLDRLDAWAYDARLLSQAPRTLDPRVVVVDIDEASLSEYGRWPWSRTTMARLVHNLTQVHGAAAVGFDMVFAENESPATDQALAKAIQNQPVVLGYYFSSDRAGHTNGQLPAPVLAQSAPFQALDWSGYAANVPVLAQAASQAGFFNAISDEDGVIRQAPLIAHFQGQHYESLALALYRRYVAGPSALPALSPVFDTAHLGDPYHHLTHLELSAAPANAGSPIAIPVDAKVAMLVPFRGPGGAAGGSFQYVSARDILRTDATPSSIAALNLKGKVILVGSTTPTLEDLRVTPFGSTYPGVEVQANLIAGLIKGSFATRPDYAVGFEVFQLLVLGLILTLLLPVLSSLAAIGATVGLLLACWLIHENLYRSALLALPSASGLALILVAYSVHSSYGFFWEAQRKRRIVHLFGHYVSPQWVQQMVKTNADNAMVASNQELTMLFCDMRGFTQLAQTLPPLALQHLLNDIFNRLSGVIQQHGGTIDKYMGDCVMAFWGAPVAQPDHAHRALRCALDLQVAMDRYNQERPTQTPVVMGIGINTGVVCVGDMGSDIRRSYTVIGDAVNIAARLEGLCKTYNQPLIVSDATRLAIERQAPSAAWHWLDLGLARIAGSEHPVTIFTLDTST